MAYVNPDLVLDEQVIEDVRSLWEEVAIRTKQKARRPGDDEKADPYDSDSSSEISSVGESDATTN
jgi:hypothetical protein